MNKNKKTTKTDFTHDYNLIVKHLNEQKLNSDNANSTYFKKFSLYKNKSNTITSNKL